MRELILAGMAFLFVVGYAPTAGAQASAKPGESVGGATPQATRAGELTVMTFNLRYASNKAPNAWPVRRPVMRDQIRAADPDVFGTQEGVYPQLKDIEADLDGDYAWVGLGREGGSKGEFMAVFYRKSRLEPMAFDHFWLSDTPEVIGSTTWGNTNRRMVTWVRFKDRVDGREFYFWNTHLDHQIQAAREKAAALIRKRMEPQGTSLPIILVGDFNAAAKGNKAYDILTEGGFLTDAWAGEEEPTFHNFTGKADPKLGRIDWIFTRGEAKGEGTKVLKFERGGQYPSDHFPVVAKVKY